MIIRYVTMTGADDNTSIQGMFDLSKKYPYAEWAILFSQSKAGVPRYPSLDWVHNLHTRYWQCENKVNLSAHLCGKWVDDAQKGRLTFLDDEEMWDTFGRVQLNMAGSRLKKCLNYENLIWECDLSQKDIIFGGPYSKYNLEVPTDRYMMSGIAPLFDASGGRGITTKVWPAPPLHEYGEPIFCGYAGGLGPENLEEELKRIEEVAGDAEIWIDMETKVRNKEDNFDLDMCETVLELAKPWIAT